MLAKNVYSTQFWNLDIEEFVVSENEKWKRMSINEKKVWVSSSGKCIFNEDLLELSRDRYLIQRKPYSPSKLIILAFKLPKYELLNQKEYCAVVINSSKPLSLDNVKVVHKSEISILMNQKREQTKTDLYEIPVRIDSNNRNIESVHFLSKYALYDDGVIINISKFYKEPKVQELGQHKERHLFRPRESSIRYYVDILVLIHFGCLKGQSYESVYENHTVFHLNSNLLDDRVCNLDIIDKTLSIVKERELREQTRKLDLYNEIVSFLKKRNAFLLTPQEQITATTTLLKIKCQCGELEHTYESIRMSEQCAKCLKYKIKNAEEEIGTLQLINGKEFVKIRQGWVCKEGLFLNNLKKEVSIHKHSCKISGETINAKETLAKVFKIPNWESTVERLFIII
jgi:hypothetical protein